MKCLSPIHRRNVFHPHDDIFKKYGSWMEFPCGRCKACIDNKRKDWYVRLKFEQRHAINSFFITLTYHHTCLPFNSKDYPTFSKSDCQSFIKLLRRHLELKYNWIGMRFFLIPEYGTENLRPHYHALLFNCPPDADMYKEVLEAWNRGMVSCEKLDDSHIGYCVNYMYGKCDMPPENFCDDSNKIFTLSSRRPGIGHSYINAKTLKWHHDHLSSYVKIDDLTYSLPRYLKNKIFDEEQRYQIFKENQKRYKEKRLEELAKHIEFYQTHTSDAPPPFIQEREQFIHDFDIRCKTHRKHQFKRKPK